MKINAIPYFFSIFFSGKGPQKEFYQKKIAQLSLKHVSICTPWLEAEDYPTLLGEKANQFRPFKIL